MDIQTLITLFMWCTIITGALFVFSVVMFMLVPDLAASVHGKLFSIPQESVGIAAYSLIGVYKILFLVFNVVPYVALLIVVKKTTVKA